MFGQWSVSHEDGHAPVTLNMFGQWSVSHEDGHARVTLISNMLSKARG